jgi:hypothetical protein
MQKLPFQPPNYYEFKQTIFLEFKNQNDLKTALERVHIYYEGKQLNGPLKGVNLPLCMIKEWKETTEMTDQEAEIIQKVMKFTENTYIVYLIAWIERDSSTLLHEWAHSVYYCNSNYRSVVQEIYNSLLPKTKKIIENELALRNYSPLVYPDEFQAYLREDPSDFGKKLVGEMMLFHQKFKEYVESIQKKDLIEIQENVDELFKIELKNLSL